MSADFRLVHWPFNHMNLAVRSYDTEMRRLLKSSRLDMARWRILMIAHEDQPVSITEVASKAIMEPSTVMRAMQKLQQSGLIVITTRAADQRVSEAVLTEAGQAAMAKVLKAASLIFHQAFASFSDSDIVLLNGMLGRIYGALREPV